MHDFYQACRGMREVRHVLVIWLLLALKAVSVFAETEDNPVHHLPSAERIDVARVIVKFKKDSSLLKKHALSATANVSETVTVLTARANSLGSRLGISLQAGRALNSHAQVVSASGISSASLALRLVKEADVEYAVADQRRTHLQVPGDPWYTQGSPVIGNTGGPIAGQWYLRAPEGEIVSSINAANAWNVTIGSPNIVIAGIDSGVRFEHPDLAGRLLAGYDMVSDLASANDGSGRDADATDPGDWITTGESYDPFSPFYQCNVENSSWHGTQIFGIMGAASNNGRGMAGVVWGANLLPVRVLGKCGGYDSDIIAGMQWAAGLPVPGVPVNTTPARVINMSLGGSGVCPQSYIDAINTIISQPSSIVIVVAAGNGSGSVGVPANCPGVIAVGGLRQVGTKVGYSDLGAEISISAPGGNCVNFGVILPCLYPILTTTNTGLTDPSASSYTDSFNVSVGTSFAAPLVAGTVALMLAVNPALTFPDINAALSSSVRAFPFRGVIEDPQTGVVKDCNAKDSNSQLQCYCTTSTCGAGMLDSASAVAAALGLKPRIAVAPDILQPWNRVILSSSGSEVGIGRKVASVQWSIVDGGGVVNAFNSDDHSPFAMLTPTAAGRFSIRLTLTDDQGLSGSCEIVLTVLPGFSLAQGWNLLGNSVDAAMDVASTWGYPASVISVWKWLPISDRWAFYAPSMSRIDLAAYVQYKGYDLLTTINGGEGFWVNAIAAFNAQLPAGLVISHNAFLDQKTPPNNLPQGWSLIALGEETSPRNFVNRIANNLPEPPAVAANSLISLWAWDSALSSWYFYSPTLDNSNGLTDYITAKGYLDFTAKGKMLGSATGFWVNHP